ncbi:hypothetical protein [Legionella parisiensis]|uniref:Uncharacterized protein n=1 Tax=Legionella parisiensis TaxID=45071 RepID=A0A1E5JU43_9GAMM|nr:hypothetical protein [Legionella parisiensis]KTD42217.1 hypothetical protein Lpar_3534 [Legionella parisiensis]OEH48042.1 hypothetical protein lpari_00979 [Legionella parisiensis]STX72284.1 Uncharacterised protein [Legionella parisiensis]
MHILISYKENPEFNLYKTRLGRDDLKYKSWLGYDKNGDNQAFTNSCSVSHILLGPIAKTDLTKVSELEPTLKFRIIEADDFIKNRTFFSTPSLKMHQVLAKTLYSSDNLDYEVTELQASILKGIIR